MITVLVVKSGSLSELDKAKLREDEIVIVEADDPYSVRWLKPSEVFDANDMMRAALYSLSKSTEATKSRFVDQLAIIAKATNSA